MSTKDPFWISTTDNYWCSSRPSAEKPHGSENISTKAAPEVSVTKHNYVYFCYDFGHTHLSNSFQSQLAFLYHFGMSMIHIFCFKANFYVIADFFGPYESSQSWKTSYNKKYGLFSFQTGIKLANWLRNDWDITILAF